MPQGGAAPGNGQPSHFIVVVPGYMGSKLRDKTTGEIVWIDFSTIPANPLRWDDWLNNLFSKMAYPNDDLEPAGIVDEVVFVPPWAKQEQYGRLVRWLEDIGYCADEHQFSEAERNVYTFSYDWRQDNRISGRKLGEAIQRWSSFHPGAKAWLIAHSNGGIISRWYIEKEGGRETVGLLLLMGSPWDGAPKSVKILFEGLDTLFRKGFNLFDIQRRTRDLTRTFPSAYQLIPVLNPFLRNLNNELVDPFDGHGWLSQPLHLQYLEDGKRFNLELGNSLSVETLCFFGRKLPTTTNGLVRFAAGDTWDSIEWFANEAGDGTVPERSAVNPNASGKYPFLVNHGDIYITPPVLEFLQWELVDKYALLPGAEDRAAALTPRLRVMFEASGDSFSPGEEISLWASVRRMEDDAPLSGAQVQVRTLWRQALPGSQAAPPVAPLPSTHLWESEGMPGEYASSLNAPQVEGYYRLVATVQAVGEPAVELEELVAIE